MAEMGILEVETYVSRNQKIVTQFIVTRPIMDLCLVEEQRPGPRISMQWWEQDGVDVEEMWTVAQEEERTKGEEETDRMATETDD